MTRLMGIIPSLNTVLSSAGRELAIIRYAVHSEGLTVYHMTSRTNYGMRAADHAWRNFTCKAIIPLFQFPLLVSATAATEID